MQKQHGSRIHYVRRFTNLGFASAHKESIAYFLSNEKYDALLQMDADQSHRVEDVPRILEKFGNDDLVIGSRYINEGAVVGWPIRRLLLSRTANLLCRILLKIEVFDATSGFRLLSRRLCHQVLNNSSEVKGYFFQIETVLSASRMKYKISEVPITFVERMSGHSKLTTKNVFEAFVSLCKMRNY
jgi:dolichol-phosphate mannosyltransferase